MPLDVVGLVRSEMIGTTGCRVCNWLRTRPPEEMAGWESVLADKALYPHAAVARAMAKADPEYRDKPSKDSVSAHRTNGHAQ